MANMKKSEMCELIEVNESKLYANMEKYEIKFVKVKKELEKEVCEKQIQLIKDHLEAISVCLNSARHKWASIYELHKSLGLTIRRD